MLKAENMFQAFMHRGDMRQQAEKPIGQSPDNKITDQMPAQIEMTVTMMRTNMRMTTLFPKCDPDRNRGGGCNSHSQL